MDSAATIVSSRDRMILVALWTLGVGCLVGVCVGISELLTPFSAIVGSLAMAWKGNPTPPAETKTTETTVSSTPAKETN
jgi:hypothetical protein